MATNRYFLHDTTEADQKLLENLVTESIQISGVDCHYIPRTLVNFDYLFGEDNISAYENAHLIEVYIESVEGFEGDGDLLSKFGLMIKDTLKVSISKSRFEQEITTRHPTILRPREGDLIFFPFGKNAVFEIKFTEHESPFYQLGKNYVYKLSLELFRYSQEDIETNTPEIDAIQIDRENDNSVSNDASANNTDIEVAADEILDFDESNPFGTP